MKKLLTLLVISSLASLAGCVTANSYTGGAALFSYLKEPIAATSNTGAGKTGEACSYNVLGLISAGNASISKAREEGGITKVATVDRTAMQILMFLFGMNCTVVTGE